MLLSSFLSLALATTAWGLRTATNAPLHKRCVNSPEDRSCWGDYDISVNYYDEAPDTGITREYFFTVENITAAPDGVEKMVQAINGQIPGPTIIADWGDTVVVHVTSNVDNNGTGIHFHGIRQNGTNQNDGVPSLTQCPIAPSNTYTYTWKATQYGSSWYHSHFYVQAWDGVFGGILINGPATANYDVDLGNLFLNDWWHDTADQKLLQAEAKGVPALDNGLLNGTMVFTGDDNVTVGSYFETTFEHGTSYLLRLVNAAAETHFQFSIDGHPLTVIANDFVPIVPYVTDSVLIAMGQRYDVIVHANASVDNYWMRAVMQAECNSQADGNNSKVLGIVRYTSTGTNVTAPYSNSIGPYSNSTGPYSNSTGTYTNSSSGLPTSTGTETSMSTAVGCIDEPYASLVPYIQIACADEAADEDAFSVKALQTAENTFIWQMGPSSFVNAWDYPTVLQVWEKNDTFASSQNVQVYTQPNQWIYWVITNSGVPHPMHIHGHDFWVLASGTDTYDASTVDLSYRNVPRRDVVMLPANGYVVIAFYTDNPGVWLFHCHIAWHTSEGLAVQIIERQDEWVDKLDMDVLNSTCAAWQDYCDEWEVTQADSGI